MAEIQKRSKKPSFFDAMNLTNQRFNRNEIDKSYICKNETVNDN